MRVDYNNPRVIEALGAAPESARKAFFKQIGFLTDDIRHPSLHAKKYDEANDIWQARMSRGWRFYFIIQGDTYTILDVIPHPK